MKIHYLITSLEAGGAGFAIPKIVKIMESYGHNVEIMGLKAGDMGTAEYLRSHGLEYHLLFKERQSGFKKICYLLRYLKKNRPDILWTSLGHATIIGQIVGKILGIPVVSLKNSTNCTFFLKYTKNISQLWVSDSPLVAEYCHEIMKIPASKIMNWSLYCCEEIREERSYWNGQEVLQLGSVGRLHEVKNYPALIKAVSLFLKKNPDKKGKIHLSFAGEGPQRGVLEALIRQEGLEDYVTLLGFLDTPKEFLKTIHIYAQPSRFEGLCLGAHEAMAAGLAVIATPVGEMCASIKDGERGFIVAHEHLAENICEKLEYIFQNPSCLEAYGKAAQDYVYAHYSEAEYQHSGRKILEYIETNLL